MIKLKVLFDNEYTAYIKEGKEEAGLLNMAIKQDKNLSNYWLIMNNLQEGECKQEDVSMFINENIALMKSVDMTRINEMAAKFPDPEYTDVEMAINTLLFENKTPANIQRFIDANGLLHSHLVGNREKSQRIATLNETLANLTEHKIIKEYLECNDRETFMENKKREATEYLNSLLENETDRETKLLIFENLHKISKKTSPDTFVENILAIDELLSE
jgi:hypothetical protein